MARPCTHGFPKPSNCYECMLDGNYDSPPPRTPRRRPTVEATFIAKFDGHCDACNLTIHAGQRISRLSDDSYQHAACARPDGDDEPDTEADWPIEQQEVDLGTGIIVPLTELLDDEDDGWIGVTPEQDVDDE